METKLKNLTLMTLLMALFACGGGKQAPSQAGESSALQTELSQTALMQAAQSRLAPKTPGAQVLDEAETRRLLDELAEVERAGAWFQGMALAESSIRESAGDYAGAVTAAYKEMAMAYGRGLIQKEDLEQGLLNVLAQTNEEAVIAAANFILAFVRGQWEAAHAGLGALFDEIEEPDGFGRWMLLVCALEKSKASPEAEDRAAAAAYKAIRARYTQFPEYWYRGARAFSGFAAAEYAERCINSSPQGVFAPECRSILASYTGLKNEDGKSIKTKSEIEAIIAQSLNTGNPKLLDDLIPLISLPDNPYTVYAVGALRSLTSTPKYRDYFIECAASSKGRLAERLTYICRG